MLGNTAAARLHRVLLLDSGIDDEYTVRTWIFSGSLYLAKQSVSDRATYYSLTSQYR